MAGYSGTPLPRKLGVREGSRVALLHAPPDFASSLGALPAGAQLAPAARAATDVIVLFATTHAQLSADLARAVAALAPTGGLWLAWPKRSARVPTDLTEATIRAVGLGTGLVDNKVCALDDIWSGLRFVVRLQDRPRWPRREEHAHDG
jgi:hypothetical protein